MIRLDQIRQDPFHLTFLTHYWRGRDKKLNIFHAYKVGKQFFHQEGGKHSILWVVVAPKPNLTLNLREKQSKIPFQRAKYFQAENFLLKSCHTFCLARQGMIYHFVWEQVRLSRATLEFQVLQVPTGFKVFNSQVIYLISFTKIFRSKKSSIQNLSLPKKVEF